MLLVKVRVLGQAHTVWHVAVRQLCETRAEVAVRCYKACIGNRFIRAEQLGKCRKFGVDVRAFQFFGFFVRVRCNFYKGLGYLLLADVEVLQWAGGRFNRLFDTTMRLQIDGVRTCTGSERCGQTT
jgi:hypothetical protein